MTMRHRAGGMARLCQPVKKVRKDSTCICDSTLGDQVTKWKKSILDQEQRAPFWVWAPGMTKLWANKARLPNTSWPQELKGSSVLFSQWNLDQEVNWEEGLTGQLVQKCLPYVNAFVLPPVKNLAATQGHRTSLQSFLSSLHKVFSQFLPKRLAIVVPACNILLWFVLFRVWDNSWPSLGSEG